MPIDTIGLGASTGTLTPEAKQYYDKKLLIRAKPKLKLYDIAQKRNLPKNGGNQISFRRFNQIATATTPLTEGVTPASSSLSMSEVTGTVQQYGNYVTMSDALDLMGIDPVMSEAAGVLGENAAQTVEEIVRAELVTGTNVVYGTGSTRGAQSSANPITLSLVRKAVRTLRVNDTEPMQEERMENGQGGLFFGYIHPRQWYDLIGDTTVQNTFIYSDPQKIYKTQVAVLGEVVWYVSTKAPVFAGQGSAGADVYGAFIVGYEAFGAVNVAGTGQFETIAKGLGSAGSADPLNQRATQGWKSYQLPKILNNNFVVRIETGVTA